MSRVHDVGGQTGFGPVPVNDGGDSQPFHADWEARVVALTTVMPPAEYISASYYERWLSALETLLTEKGIA